MVAKENYLLKKNLIINEILKNTYLNNNKLRIFKQKLIIRKKDLNIENQNIK